AARARLVQGAGPVDGTAGTAGDSRAVRSDRAVLRLQAGFVLAAAPLLPVADHLEAPPPELDTSSGRRRIVNHDAGLALEAPVSWRTRVRKKKKPVGSCFFDREDWQSPDDAREWNALLAEGPAKCKI